jgi:hypothetical protein
MNYCSIEDAWGKVNYMSNQYKEYMSNTTPEVSTKQTEEPKQYQHSYNRNSENKTRRRPQIIYENFDGCDNFINHIKTCKTCYNKTKNHFKPHIIEGFQELVDCNRDTIVLVLVGISILLFFNLLNNLTTNNK